MRIAITTPTGRVGSAVLRSLLASDAQLVLLARKPKSLTTEVERRVTVHQGDLADRAYVTRSMVGVDTLFWVTPSNPRADELRASQKQMGVAAAAAIEENSISRVVNLSSMGAHHKSGNGPVDGLHDVELEIGRTAKHVIHLRPGYFLENYEMQCPSIAQKGCVFLPVSGTASVPMVAAGDVALAAARALVDEGWCGRIVHELCPPPATFDEAAERISAALDMPVRHVQVSDEEARANLRKGGLSEDVANSMCELFQGIERGTLAPASEAKQRDASHWTSIKEFARKSLRPRFQALQQDSLAT